MKNIEHINKPTVDKIVSAKKIAEFSPGDTVKVGVNSRGKKTTYSIF